MKPSCCGVCGYEFTIAHFPDRVFRYQQTYKWLVARLSAGNWSHWREGLNALSVTFVAFAISLSVSSFLLPAPYGSASLDYYLLRKSLFWLRLSIMLTIFFIGSAYPYKYDCKIQHPKSLISKFLAGEN